MNRYQDWIIGEKFPQDIFNIPLNGGAFEFLSDESAVFILHFMKILPEELFAFNNSSVEIGIHKENKIAFFALNIGSDFGTYDCDIHMDTVIRPKEMHMMKAKEGTGLTLYLALVDEKNVLRALRKIALGTDITNYLCDIIRYQQTEDGHLKDFNERSMIVDTVYARYPTCEDLFNACEKKYKVGTK